MKSLCVLLTFQPVYEPQRALAGMSVAGWLDRVLETTLPGVPRVGLGPFSTASALVDGLKAVSGGFEELILVQADGPFLRADLITGVLDLHRSYRADYTFGDGFPVGLVPEVLRPGILEVLASWASNREGPVDRDTVFQLLSTDINRFDVETLLSPIDLRARRLSLTADNRRNRLLMDRFADDTGKDTPSLLAALEASADRSRTLAATLHVQITDGVLQVPAWSPLSRFVPDALGRRNALDRSVWNDLLDRALGWAGDLTVVPSFWGEPSLHPEIVGLLCDALAKPGLRVCLETSGLGWSGIDLSPVAAAALGNLDWIVELDSDVPDTYRLLRGEGFDAAHQFCSRLIGQFPGHVWPQAVRMQSNEAEMEGFFQRWKDEAGRVVVQKHNDFGGRLPRAKPSDLSPWKRHPCWHLARDLAMFLDGTTVVCRDDFDRTQVLGNLRTEDFATVWARGEELFRSQVQGNWTGVCRNCDEWYTFHF